MKNHFPGMTIECLSREKGASGRLFDGIFAMGGITLSQVSVMTGLEPYMIQNWVKRGFVSSPVKRMYSKQQFARIVMINMLRESLPIDTVCGLIRMIGGAPEDPSDDLIGDDTLYHLYVDLWMEGGFHADDPPSVTEAVNRACQPFTEMNPGDRKKLARILQTMLYAHVASLLRKEAERVLSTMDEPFGR